MVKMMSKELKLITLVLENLYSFIDDSRISKEKKGYALEMKNDLKLEIKKALKRNEPLKVNHKEDKGITTVGTCGNCGGLVNEVNDNYCSLCGQRLDWSDEDE